MLRPSYQRTAAATALYTAKSAISSSRRMVQTQSRYSIAGRLRNTSHSLRGDSEGTLPCTTGKTLSLFLPQDIARIVCSTDEWKVQVYTRAVKVTFDFDDYTRRNNFIAELSEHTADNVDIEYADSNDVYDYLYKSYLEGKYRTDE